MEIDESTDGANPPNTELADVDRVKLGESHRLTGDNISYIRASIVVLLLKVVKVATYEGSGSRLSLSTS